MDKTAKSFMTEVCTKAYKFLGAHPLDAGFVFRVWAPHARAVALVGDFTQWDTNAIPMRPIGGGVWEARSECAKIYDNYKFRIEGKRTLYKSDP